MSKPNWALTGRPDGAGHLEWSAMAEGAIDDLIDAVDELPTGVDVEQAIDTALSEPAPVAREGSGASEIVRRGVNETQVLRRGVLDSAVYDSAASAAVAALGTDPTVQDAVLDAAANLDFPLLAKVASGAAVRNDISEWWVDPVAVSGVDARGGFTLKGGIGRPDPSLPPYRYTAAGGGETVAAPVTVTEWRPGLPVRQVIVGYSPADDHNPCTVVAEPGRRRLAILTAHDLDQLTRIAISDRSGRIESMADGTGAMHTFTRFGVTAYAQVVLDQHRSTPELSYYWMLQRVRRGTAGNYIPGWTLTEFTVDETVDRGGITLLSQSQNPGHGQRYLIRNYGAGRSYLIGHTEMTDAGQVWRFLYGQHPSGDGRLALFEINLQTGAISGAATGNVFFTPPSLNDGAIYEDDLDWLTPELVGERRRFFYRERDGFLWAKWTIGEEDEATYIYSERVKTQGEPDDFDGLRTTPDNGGYAVAEFRPQQQAENIFRYSVVLTDVPSTLPGTVDVIRRWTDSTSGSWYGRLTDDFRWVSGVARSDITPPWVYTFPGALPGLAGSDWYEIQVEVEVDDDGEGKVRLWYRDNPQGELTTHGVGTFVTGGSPAPLPYREGADPLRLGWGTATPVALTFESVWLDVDGARAVDVDFVTGWTPHTAAHVDMAGQPWLLYGDALVGSTSAGPPVDAYVDHHLGVAGPRIGHGAAANYIGGGCIVVDDEGDTVGVVTAHRLPSATELRMWRRRPQGGFVPTLIARTPEVLARPVHPRGESGPIEVLVSAIRSYGQGTGEFTDYDADAYAY